MDFLLTNEGYLDICHDGSEGQAICNHHSTGYTDGKLVGSLMASCRQSATGFGIACGRTTMKTERSGWTEGLIHAALTTVLHLGSVAEPVAMVNGMRQRYSLVAWLDGLRQ